MDGACGTCGGEERYIRGFIIIASHSHTRKHVAIVLRPVFRFSASTSPCQQTPLFNLRPLIFGLTPFDCLRSSTLTSTYSSISYGNVLLMYFFIYDLFFRNTTRAGNKCLFIQLLVKVNVNRFCSTLKTVL
jgi:hypothetical protein